MPALTTHAHGLYDNVSENRESIVPTYIMGLSLCRAASPMISFMSTFRLPEMFALFATREFHTRISV